MRNFHDLPPYGFFVYVPETNWESPKYIGLDAAIKEVQKHRIANSRFGWPTDAESVRNYILAYTEQRLRSMPGGEQWLAPGPSEAPPGFSLPRRQRSQRPGERNAAVGSTVETVKNTLAGIGLWMDWFSDSPVPQDVANARAACCARCPINERDGNVLQRFNEVAAGEILAIFSSLKHRKLQTPHDEMLGVCGACDCPMKAKVWSPLNIISGHLRSEAREKLWSECWIPREEKELHPTEALG